MIPFLYKLFSSQKKKGIYRVVLNIAVFSRNMWTFKYEYSVVADTAA